MSADPDTRIPLTVERVLLAVSMGAMALIGFANVLTRYLTDISLAFTEEYSVLLMVVMTLVGTSYAFTAGRHIRVEYLIGLFPAGVQRWAELIGLVLAVGMFVVLIVYGVEMTWDSYRFRVSSPGLGNPEWIYLSVVPIFCALALVRILGRIVRVFRDEREK